MREPSGNPLIRIAPSVALRDGAFDIERGADAAFGAAGSELHWGRTTQSLVETAMIRGSCLCGGVRFELDRAAGPFELCHCTRCRKASGSAFVAGIYAKREDLRLLQGQDLVRTYDAPLRDTPPPYRACFCSRCGSPLPDLESRSPTLEIPAGILDDDPALRPDKHIFVEHKAPWFAIADALPQLDKATLYRQRRAEEGDAHH